MVRPPFPSYQGSEPYTFVCYSHEDSEDVYADLVWLREQGLHIWYDEGISPGAGWRDEVARAIKGASLFLLYISPSAVESPHCEREFRFAIDENINLLPVYLTPTVLPLELRFLILDRQAIMKHRLPTDAYRHSLVAAMQRIIDRRPNPSVTLLAGSVEDRLHIGVAAKTMNETELELSSSLTRYLSWQGGIYRSHHLSSHGGTSTPQRLLDYRIDVAVHRRGEDTEASWELVRADNGAMISGHRSSEGQATFTRKLDRIVERIGEGAIKAIGIEEMRGIASPTLGYGRLVLLAEHEQLNDLKGIRKRLELLERAIELEPNSGCAHASLAGALSWGLLNGASEEAARDKKKSQDEAELALRYEPNDPFVLLTVGKTYCRLGSHEGGDLLQSGLGLLRRSCELAPTVQAKDWLAVCLCFDGKPDQAVPLFEQILESRPWGYTFPYVRLAVALTQAGRLQDAVPFAKDAVLHYPEDWYGWVVQANLLAQLGDASGARDAVNEARKCRPKLDLEIVIKGTERTYGRTDDQRRWLTAGLRALQVG